MHMKKNPTILPRKMNRLCQGEHILILNTLLHDEWHQEVPRHMSKWELICSAGTGLLHTGQS